MKSVFELHVSQGLRVRRLALAASVVASALGLAACGGGEASKSTQTAAKVNSDEISVHQINQVLQRTPGLKQDQVNAAGKRVLEGLIDQQLAIQGAQEEKLDRDPGVVAAIENAKREILARAYTDKIASSVHKPTAEEIGAFYASKPALFGDRKVYTLKELRAEVPQASIKATAGKLSGLSLEAAGAQLDAAGIKYSVKTAEQLPEQIPLALLEQVAKLQPGQALVLQSPGTVNVLTVTASKPQPVTLEQAKGPIERYISNDRRRKAVEERLTALRKQAKIEYTANFAGAAASAAPAAPASAASGLDASSIQKGLSGLK